MQTVSHKPVISAVIQTAVAASMLVTPASAIPAKVAQKSAKAPASPSPKAKVTAAIDAMCAAFDKWTAEELQACAEEIAAWHAGQIDDIDLQTLENWRDEVANKGRLAFVTFDRENPETGAAYIKASDEYKAWRQAKAEAKR